MTFALVDFPRGWGNYTFDSFALLWVCAVCAVLPLLSKGIKVNYVFALRALIRPFCLPRKRLTDLRDSCCLELVSEHLYGSAPVNESSSCKSLITIHWFYLYKNEQRILLCEILFTKCLWRTSRCVHAHEVSQVWSTSRVRSTTFIVVLVELQPRKPATNVDGFGTFVDDSRLVCVSTFL